MFDSYAEVFAERAGSYHSAMRRSPRARDAEFRSVLQPLADAPNGLVCDMPAGGCYLAAYLRPGMRYVGIEPADDFLCDAPQRQGSQALNAPITDVPLADGSVDYLVSLAGLHHEPSLAPVFGEMRRLVRPGGRVVIADVEVDTPPAGFLNGFVARNNPMGHDGRFLDRRTPAMLHDAGLPVVRDELVQVPWRFQDLETAGRFCRELFGLADIGVAAVSDALAREIGFDVDQFGLRLRWTLRRIVCEVA